MESGIINLSKKENKVIKCNHNDNGMTVNLRILTGEEHRKIKLQRLRKMRIWIFGLLVNQINSF